MQTAFEALYFLHPDRTTWAAWLASRSREHAMEIPNAVKTVFSVLATAQLVYRRAPLLVLPRQRLSFTCCFKEAEVV